MAHNALHSLAPSSLCLNLHPLPCYFFSQGASLLCCPWGSSSIPRSLRKHQLLVEILSASFTQSNIPLSKPCPQCYTWLLFSRAVLYMVILTSWLLSPRVQASCQQGQFHLSCPPCYISSIQRNLSCDSTTLIDIYWMNLHYSSTSKRHWPLWPGVEMNGHLLLAHDGILGLAGLSWLAFLV